MRAVRHAAAVLAVAAIAGCGGDEKGATQTTTVQPPAQTAPSAPSDTALVRCLEGQSFITVKPGAGQELIVTTDKGERAVIRTYDNLHDALEAGHKANLDLDQIVSRQTIEYVKPGTGQIKIAVDTCT